jgi:LmbE family N-acetylglucosaminyl deacetylase
VGALDPDRLSAPDAPVIALIAAHPDDEVAGAGSLIPSLKRGWLVHVTDGAPRYLFEALANGIITREQYALARNREARAALTIAGFPEARLVTMGLVDQEASLDMAGLARAICALIVRLKPDAVLTHPYEGGHPDHDATAFAVHAGLALLARSSERESTQVPEILEMACYHGGSGSVPVIGAFLDEDGEPLVLKLAPEALELKERMIACFTTQRRALGMFDLGTERYRTAPRYDFTEPPHPGLLLYEQYPWGMERERFNHLAREALAALDLEGRL